MWHKSDLCGEPARTESHAGLAQKLRGSHWVPLTGLSGTRAVFNYAQNESAAEATDPQRGIGNYLPPTR